ncbi:hypothetical protein [Listeria booriae]|nr:hypothetical protein [Listeria booriae]
MSRTSQLLERLMLDEASEEDIEELQAQGVQIIVVGDNSEEKG